MDRSGRRYTQFKNFKKYNSAVNENEKLSAAFDKIKNSSKSKYSLKSKVNDVIIDPLWVETIEFYLPYISAAINENRKFIRNNAETVPIEKAKKVSRESVIDLAANSQNIRKIKEDNEIEPSKLLIVEKLDDYTVYENKFLVYLLKMLKSFIEIRFDRIKEAKSLFESDTQLKDKSNLYRNNISYSIEIKDERYRDLNLEENDKNIDLIKRIRNIEVVVNQLMRTSLIEIVSKAPSIRLPIQRTNVLKNDVNFSKCLALYEFLSSYSKPGYEVNPIETHKKTLSDEFLNYFSAIPTLIAFLSYAETKDVYPLYEEEFNKEKEELRIIELETCMKKIHEMFGEGKLDHRLIYNYIINMEHERIKLQEEIASLKVEHENEIKKLNEEKAIEIAKINQDHRQEILNLNSEHANEVKSLNEKYNELDNTFKNEMKLSSDKINSLNEAISELNGRVKGLQILLNPKIDLDDLSEDYFNQLEMEKNAFDKYFASKWKLVKKDMLKRRKKQAIAEVKQARIDKVSDKANKKNEKEMQKAEIEKQKAEEKALKEKLKLEEKNRRLEEKRLEVEREARLQNMVDEHLNDFDIDDLDEDEEDDG